MRRAVVVLAGLLLVSFAAAQRKPDEGVQGMAHKLGGKAEAPVDEQVLEAANWAVKHLDETKGLGAGKQGLKLQRVEKAEKQIVAGTRLYLTLHLQVCAHATAHWRMV